MDTSTGKLLLKVPLSNNTISRRIEYMAKSKDNNKDTIEHKALCSMKDTHFICYVRFIDGN